MKPVLAYFISGELNGEHVEIIEETMKYMFPTRYTTVFYVKNISEKNRILDELNVEELDDPGLIDILWKAVDEYDNNN